MKIELKHAIPIPGKSADGTADIEIETKTLTFGRIKAKHVKLFPASVFEGEEAAKKIKPHEMIPLIAGLTGIPIESAEELDFVDLQMIGGEVLPSFLEGYLPADQKQTK